MDKKTQNDMETALTQSLKQCRLDLLVVRREMWNGSL